MSGMPQTEEDAEVGSLSSGGASEYAPPDDEPGPSRKGKARATTNKLIDSDDAMSSGAAVEESDVDEEEGEDLKPVTHSSGLPHRKSGGGVIFPPTYHSSDLHLFPQAYRQLIKEASARLAKPDPTAEDLRRDKERLKVLDKLRATGLDAFPHGPTTPFITRLLEKPGVGSERIKVDLDGGRTHERKKRTKMITDHSQLLEAWESWQGEAWWPEMFGSNSKQSKGKGRMSAKGGGSELPSGWVHRSEVTLGLAQVGRIPLDKLDLLSEEAAQPFLPRLAEHTKAPTVNVYLGLHDDQKPVRFGMYDAHRLEEFGNTKPGSIFYTGGPIWGMDWCPVSDRAASVFGGTQYLAVSVMPNIDATPGIGLKCAAEETASIQIWSMIPSALETGEMGQLSCDMVLCVEGGSGIEVRWMPLGACDEVDLAKVDSAVLPKLGILGVVQLDGSLSFYAVPHPKVIRHLRGMDDSSKRPLYVRVKPLLKIEVDDAACMCFDYVSGTRVAVGLSNGHCGIWGIDDALRNTEDETPLPSAYFPVAFSAIRTVTVGRHPPLDVHGEPMYGEDPYLLMVGSYDGTASMVDMRDPRPIHELYKMRTPVLASAWSSQIGAPLNCDVDFAVVLQKIRGRGNSRAHVVTVHRGPVWSAATSEYHTMLASASSDGSVIVNSLQEGYRRRRGVPLVWLRLYEVDYDTHSGDYRIVDDYAPETMMLERALRSSMAPGKTKKQEYDPALVKTAAWAPQVGVHRVAWHSGAGLGRAGWLASGGASGLARVEMVVGQWRDGAVPAALGP